jgi:hypothetical protein
MKTKGTKFWVALAVPFIVIILFLVKLYHTIQTGRSDSFTSRGGMVFTEEQFMQNFEADLPLDRAIYAVVAVRKQTNILDVIKSQKNEHSDNKRYHWLAIGIKSENQKNWLVTFRENNVVPKMICQTMVEVQTGKVSELDCKKTEVNEYGL